MDLQQTRGSNVSEVDGNARLSCGAKFKKKKKERKKKKDRRNCKRKTIIIGHTYRARRRCDFVRGAP
jgi:hypothetical protein